MSKFIESQPLFIKEVKDQVIQIRLTKPQKETIKEMADEKSMTITEYILYLVQQDYWQS